MTSILQFPLQLSVHCDHCLTQRDSTDRLPTALNEGAAVHGLIVPCELWVAIRRRPLRLSVSERCGEEKRGDEGQEV